MYKTILRLLKEADDSCLSREAIAGRLGISGEAVQEQIQNLKCMGYGIEKVPNSGYVLKSVPDLLLPEEVQDGLNNAFIGKNIVYFDTIMSTNNEAKRIAAQENAPEGTVVVSEEQGGGKGRLSRTWFSPKQKGLWFSVILRPEFLPQEAPKCTLMVAVAIVKAAKRFGIELGIKWPNDILYEGKKLNGTLTEMSADVEHINYVVVGTGINVNIMPDEFPDEVRDIATSIAIIKGEKVSRVKLFQAVLEELERLYLKVREAGFAPMFDEWRKYSVTLGMDVNVIGVGDHDSFAGRAVDIDEDGALLIETENGVRKVFAGDVSIRPRQ